jgi:hypothetical protein
MKWRMFWVIVAVVAIWVIASLWCMTIPWMSFFVIPIVGIFFAYFMIGLIARDNAITSNLGEWIAVGKQD